LIVTMLVLLASLTPMPEAPWWQESGMVGFFQQLAEWTRGVIPDDAIGKFNL
jgi:membrane protein required for colicin V production